MIEHDVRRMLERLVDYAGLFPPAKLPMERTVSNFADYRGSAQSWMLGRLIVPIARLVEFEEVAGGMLPRSSSSDGWRISGLLPPAEAPDTRDLSAAMQAVASFNMRHSAAELGFAKIDTLEVRCGCCDSIEAVAKILPPGIVTYVELSVDDQLESNLDAIAAGRDRLRAKIRTGGVTPELIPAPEIVLRFVAACVEKGVPFKATAGLHHPIRAANPLTYERDPDVAYMHGFVNLLLATGGLLTGQLDEEGALALLDETDPSAFRVDADRGWCWGAVALGQAEIEQTRSRGLVSFGSCSFIEPVEDLQALGHSLCLTTGC